MDIRIHVHPFFQAIRRVWDLCLVPAVSHKDIGMRSRQKKAEEAERNKKTKDMESLRLR